MHHADAVRRGQSCTRLPKRREDLIDGALLLEPAPKRHPLQQLHHDVEVRRALDDVAPDVEDLDHVAMAELRERPRLTRQSLLAFDGGSGGDVLDDLECDVAVELGIVGAVHRPEAAFAELLVELIAPDLDGPLATGEARRDRCERTMALEIERRRGRPSIQLHCVYAVTGRIQQRKNIAIVTR